MTQTKHERRLAIEKYVITILSLADPSGFNTEHYKKYFAQLSDEAFDQFMQELRDKKRTLVLYAPNFVVTLKMQDLLAAARAVGLDLFERIRLWDSVTRRYFLTAQKYLILQLPVRRLKQYLMDKISVPEGDKKIDLFTGQVVKPDKGSAVSLPEAQTMDSKGLYASMTELLNVRGGNLTSYAAFKSSLEETGQASLGAIESGAVRSTKVAEVLLNSMHLDNNLSG